MPRFGMLENCGFLLGSHWDIIMFIIQLLSYRISHHINQLMHDFVYQPIKPSWDIGVLVLKRWTSRHPNDIQDQAEKKPNQIPRWVDFQHKNSDMFCQSFTKHPQSHVECQTHTHLKGICTVFFLSECCYGLIVSVRVDSTQSICGQPLTVMLPDSLALIPS